MNKHVKIPKILHHVWLGKQQIPNNLRKCVQTCYDVQSEWKHMYWTDNNLPDMSFFKKEYNIDNNYARKSDLVRLMALYQYGGVYLDTDVECIKPIDHLIEDYIFVVATEAGNPGKFNPNREHINNAVIASTKMNPVLLKLITTVKENYKNIDIRDKSPLNYVAQLAGPPVFNKLSRFIKSNKRAKVYEYQYFYPLHYTDRTNVNEWQIPSNRKNLDRRTHLIHHFAASWYNQK